MLPYFQYQNQSQIHIVAGVTWLTGRVDRRYLLTCLILECNKEGGVVRDVAGSPSHQKQTYNWVITSQNKHYFEDVSNI